MNEAAPAIARPKLDDKGEWETYACAICGHQTDRSDSKDLGRARGNTERFKNDVFPLWRCPKCGSIHNCMHADMADIYSDYPLNRMRRLDVFARGTMPNIVKRLTDAGLRNSHRICDYGTGNGVFVQFLKEQGYQNVVGYDPFVEGFEHFPSDRGGFDCVVCNDVIEHFDQPRDCMRECVELTKPGGLLYVGTADPDGVESMQDLEPELMRLHLPFHRVLFNQENLRRLGREQGLEELACYERSYMDTLRPFANYRFLDEYSKALGHNMDRQLDPKEGSIVVKKPWLMFYGLFGYFFPCAIEPACVWRRPAGAGEGAS